MVVQAGWCEPSEGSDPSLCALIFTVGIQIPLETLIKAWISNSSHFHPILCQQSQNLIKHFCSSFSFQKISKHDFCSIYTWSRLKRKKNYLLQCLTVRQQYLALHAMPIVLWKQLFNFVQHCWINNIFKNSPWSTIGIVLLFKRFSIKEGFAICILFQWSLVISRQFILR